MEGFPPPHPVEQDPATLRLICSAFDVLHGNMPLSRCNMRNFRLASVVWEQACVLEPEDSVKVISMRFSNGMDTPTECIVVIFSNGYGHQRLRHQPQVILCMACSLIHMHSASED